MLGPDGRVRPLPRSPLRSDHAARLLLAVRVLQQHRRVGTLLALHRRDAEPVAAAVARRQGAGAPAPDGEDAGARGADCARCRARRGRRSTRSRRAPIQPPAPIVASGVRSRRRRQDAGQRAVANAGRVEGCAGPARSGRTRAAIQRRQLGRASRRADLQPHRPVLARAAPAADRTAGPRRRPAPVARVDRRRQPRLRADARSRPRRSSASIHFWPGNAVAVRAVQPLPLDAWSQLVVTYDGSSRAAGIRLYLNGAPLDVEVDPRSSRTRTSPTIRRRATTSASSRA